MMQNINTDILFASDDYALSLIWSEPPDHRAGLVPGLAIDDGTHPVMVKAPAEWIKAAKEDEASIKTMQDAATRISELQQYVKTLERHVQVIEGQLDVVRAAVIRVWALS